MESIRCTCKCSASIGDFANLWTQIGKSYFSPVIPPGSLAVASHGSVRLGEAGTLVEACHLQDITCLACDCILGIKCLDTPTNHVLDENQILLRATSILPVNQDGSRANLAIKRYLKLREPWRGAEHRDHRSSRGVSAGGRDSYQPPELDISQLQADLDAQRGEIDRIDSAGFRVVSALDEAVARVEGDLGRVRSTLSELQRDLRGNQDGLASLRKEVADGSSQKDSDRSAIRKLEAELQSAHDAIHGVRRDVDGVAAELRQDLARVTAELHDSRESIQELGSLVRDRVSVRDHAKEMASVRSELAQVRRQMEENSRATPHPGQHFSSRELDILTSNIAKIGNRASQVESLQMEFEIYKGRVERIERRENTELSPYDRYDDDGDEDDDDDDFNHYKHHSARRKRPSSGPDSSSKRAFPRFPDTPDSSGRVSKHPSPVANSGKAKVEGTRLTRTGGAKRALDRPMKRRG